MQLAEVRPFPTPMENPSGTDLPRKRVVLLGATGSIGANTLRVIAAHRDRLELVAIAARSNAKGLAAIARKFGVRHAAIFDEKAAVEARRSGDFPAGTRILSGMEGLVELARLPEADSVLVAVVGTTGLEPALAALAAGKELALASKEILVLAGRFVVAAAKASRAKLIPVDSEHNAVFQCIEGHPVSGVRQIILTASGGAFRDWPLARLAQATPADALRHPNWSMGPKVTVDSATLANKGLELIEAQWLFGVDPGQISAVIHPQSIVHCIVGFNDGAMLAQLCPPSMTFPIQHALLHPGRWPGVESPLDFSRLFSLEFRPVDESRFPMLRLGRNAMLAGGIAPAVFNAANEVAVGAFLGGKIPFLAISGLVDDCLAEVSNFEPQNLAAVIEADAEARRTAARRLSVIRS
ncbi:MAG: 1-deoxy-D-xylulose-5-phosphate reductoisomerase [Opitutaceae bacterium]|jgi:1-deoxy-D-xylulose-5-phosphate reductoisomerase